MSTRFISYIIRTLRIGEFPFSTRDISYMQDVMNELIPRLAELVSDADFEGVLKMMFGVEYSHFLR